MYSVTMYGVDEASEEWAMGLGANPGTAWLIRSRASDSASNQSFALGSEFV